MARFIQISDDDVERFNEEPKTKIGEKKTFCDTKVFLEFLVAKGERRKIEERFLKNLAKRFVLSFRKKNGEVF
jgi:hypothetical protein